MLWRRDPWGNRRHAASRRPVRLAEYTDFTLRVLMYCAANADRLVTVGELAERFQLGHDLSIDTLLQRIVLIDKLSSQGGQYRAAAAFAADRGFDHRAAKSAIQFVEQQPGLFVGNGQRSCRRRERTGSVHRAKQLDLARPDGNVVPFVTDIDARAAKNGGAGRL